MKKYEGEIPKTVAQNVAMFYNTHTKGKKILTVCTIDQILSEGGTVLVNTNEIELDITAVSIYFIFQSQGNETKTILSSNSRHNTVFRTPVSIGTPISSLRSYESVMQKCIRYRYVIYECSAEKYKITYPERTVLTTIRLDDSTTNHKISFFSSPARACKVTEYNWVVERRGYYSLHLHGKIVAKVLLCINSRNMKGIQCSVTTVTQLLVDKMENIETVLDMLKVLALNLGTSYIIIPQTKFNILEKIPVIDFITLTRLGFVFSHGYDFDPSLLGSSKLSIVV